MKILLQSIAILLCVSCASVNMLTNIGMNEVMWQDFGSLHYGDEPSQYIEITAPKYSKKNVNVIFFIKGLKNKMVDPIFLEKYRDEFIIVKFDYQNPMLNLMDTNINKLLNDINDSLLALKDHTEAKGIQTNKTILIGSSFGATLALMYGYTFYDISPIPIAFCVSMAGLTDMTDAMNLQLIGWPSNPLARAWINLSPTLAKTEVSSQNITKFGYAEDEFEKLKIYSPIYYVNECVPPTIIIHDTNDKIVPFSNSVSLSHVLSSYGVPNIFIQSTTNSGHLLGCNVNNSNKLVFAPNNDRSDESSVKRQTRKINPLIEEKLLDSFEQFIALFCQNALFESQYFVQVIR